MSKKIFAAFLALFMLLQIPAVVDAFEDFGIETAAEAASYKLSKPVISKLSNTSAGVKITWGKVSGAERYLVLRKSGTKWVEVDETTSTSYTFKTTASGTKYTFTVRCITKSGAYASGYDKTGKAITFIAAPKISKLSNASTGVKITWGKVNGAAKYRVLLKTSSGWKTVADTTSTSYTYKTTNSGKKYTFTVRCVSSTGKSYTSYYDTKGKSITFIAKPALKKISSTETGVKLTWNAVEGAYKYRVLRKTSDGWKKVTDTAKTGYTYKSAVNGKSYTLTVRCIDENGNYVSAYDTTGKTIKYADPNAAGLKLDTPVISNLTNTSSGVKITWGAVKGAKKYQVMLKTSDGWKALGTTTSTAYTYKTTNSGKKYTFTVQCVDADNKAVSAYDKTGKSIIFLKKPVIGSAACVPEGIRLTWKAVGGADTYLVLMNTDAGWQTIGTTDGTKFIFTDVADGGSYVFSLRCVDKSGDFTSYSDKEGTRVRYSCPKITSQPPETALINNGTDGSISISAWGSNIVFEWYYRDPGDHAFTLDPRCTDNIYIMEMTPAHDGREVYCVVTDEFGVSVQTDTAVLYCEYPEFIFSQYYEGDKLTVQVSKYIGKGGDVVVPERYEGLPVARIYANVFFDCTGLTSIKLPDTLTYIGQYAFSGCTGLTSVTIPDSVTTIGLGLFDGCTSLKTARLSDGLNSLSYRLFANCTSLRNVDLPRNLTIMDNSVFRGCSALTSIDLPGGITKLDHGVFAYCSSLQSIDLPEGLNSIGCYTFEGCDNLTSVDLPDSLTYIDSLGFLYCSNLTFTCGKDTYAHQWCIDNNEQFVLR